MNPAVHMVISVKNGHFNMGINGDFLAVGACLKWTLERLQLLHSCGFYFSFLDAVDSPDTHIKDYATVFSLVAPICKHVICEIG